MFHVPFLDNTINHSKPDTQRCIFCSQNTVLMDIYMSLFYISHPTVVLLRDRVYTPDDILSDATHGGFAI